MEKALPLDVARKVCRDAYMAVGNRHSCGGDVEGHLGSPLFQPTLTPLPPVLKSRWNACRGRLARSLEGEFRRIRPWQFYNVAAFLQSAVTGRWQGPVVKQAQSAHVGRKQRITYLRRFGISLVDTTLAALGPPDSMRM
jgi:hypothetical protein